MTKIFGTNSGIGEWMMAPFTNGDAEKMSKVKETVSESDIVEARQQIEKCAESGDTFHFGSDTPDNVKRDLMEYAEVVGLPGDRISQVESSVIRTSRDISEVNAITQKEPKNSPQPIFDIMPTITTDPKVFSSDRSWNETKSAKSMDYRPDDNGVIPIRGGEEYELNPVKGVRSGENSIANPEAIDSLASSVEKSSLDMIREQNQRKRSEFVFDTESWESDRSASMDGKSIIPDSGYRMVESPQSQNHTSSGEYRESMMSDSDSPRAPELTVGERLSEMNEKRASEISREKEDDDWEKMESSVSTRVSDLFYKNLEKNLNK